MKHNVRIIVFQAMIGAIYAVLTIALAPISYGQLQVRVSEALTVLPWFNPMCAAGLTIGCLCANIYGGSVMDIIFGTLATCVSAICTAHIKNKWLAPLPPVIINALIVGAVLAYSAGGFEAYPVIALQIGVEQTVACYGLGLPLMKVLEKHSDVISNGGFLWKRK